MPHRQAQRAPYKLPRELGLFLVVNPNGSKWWRFSYSFDAKEKLLSLDTYPDVPLSPARTRRDEARRLVATVVDPSAQRREHRDAEAASPGDSFVAVVERWKADELAGVERLGWRCQTNADRLMRTTALAIR